MKKFGWWKKGGGKSKAGIVDGDARDEQRQPVDAAPALPAVAPTPSVDDASVEEAIREAEAALAEPPLDKSSSSPASAGEPGRLGSRTGSRRRWRSKKVGRKESIKRTRAGLSTLLVDTAAADDGILPELDRICSPIPIQQGFECNGREGQVGSLEVDDDDLVLREEAPDDDEAIGVGMDAAEMKDVPGASLWSPAAWLSGDFLCAPMTACIAPKDDRTVKSDPMPRTEHFLEVGPGQESDRYGSMTQAATFPPATCDTRGNQANMKAMEALNESERAKRQALDEAKKLAKLKDEAESERDAIKEDLTTKIRHIQLTIKSKTEKLEEMEGRTLMLSDQIEEGKMSLALTQASLKTKIEEVERLSGNIEAVRAEAKWATKTKTDELEKMDELNGSLKVQIEALRRDVARHQANENALTELVMEAQQVKEQKETDEQMELKGPGTDQSIELEKMQQVIDGLRAEIEQERKLKDEALKGKATVELELLKDDNTTMGANDTFSEIGVDDSSTFSTMASTKDKKVGWFQRMLSGGQAEDESMGTSCAESTKSTKKARWLTGPKKWGSGRATMPTSVVEVNDTEDGYRSGANEDEESYESASASYSISHSESYTSTKDEDEVPRSKTAIKTKRSGSMGTIDSATVQKNASSDVETADSSGAESEETPETESSTKKGALGGWFGGLVHEVSLDKLVVQ